MYFDVDNRMKDNYRSNIFNLKKPKLFLHYFIYAVEEDHHIKTASYTTEFKLSKTTFDESGWDG